MIDALLDFMLGQLRVIGVFYFQYQVIFNTLIVGCAFFKIIASRKQTRE